jgi:GDP-L-fucose synthase
MKILVTGSNGLLGNALKKILGDNHVYHSRQIVDLQDRKKTFEYFKLMVEKEGVDTVIHCAAKVGGIVANMNNNQGFFLENYEMNNNVIHSCSTLGIQNFVNVLSTCIFPNENITYPLTPNQIDLGPPHPSNYGYSYAKRLSGYETQIMRNVLHKNWYSVVPTNLYGPHDNFNLENSHLIPGMIHRAYLSKKNGNKFLVWGDGTQLRQFVYSEDLAKLIIWSLENWKEERHCMMINEPEVSILEIANIIKKRFNIHDEDTIFDTSKPKGQFRKPATSDIKKFEFEPIESGINKTIDWFLSNFENIRK